MSFALVHVCVRNDEHCPSCRKYYISFYCSFQDAYQAAIAQLGELDDVDASTLQVLKDEGSCCVDEWARRSNGDSYSICPVTSGSQLDLKRPFDLAVGHERPVSAEDVYFMALSISVDKRARCPDNIRFRVSTFATAEQAAQDLFVQEHYDPSVKLLERLQAFHPVWLRQGKSADGRHAQVLPIQRGVVVYLNASCRAIQNKAWFAQKKKK